VTNYLCQIDCFLGRSGPLLISRRSPRGSCLWRAAYDLDFRVRAGPIPLAKFSRPARILFKLSWVFPPTSALLPFSSLLYFCLPLPTTPPTPTFTRSRTRSRCLSSFSNSTVRFVAAFPGSVRGRPDSEPAAHHLYPSAPAGLGVVQLSEKDAGSPVFSARVSKLIWSGEQ